jgi:hypothetical protein
MRTPSDGGPAFPIQAFHFTNSNGKSCMATGSDGMTLRDYFAAAALMGMMNTIDPPDSLAIWAYRHADAMLSERLKRKGGRT